MSLELIEMNLGEKDCHCRRFEDGEIYYEQIKKVIDRLPWSDIDLGIGGRPLRFDWWQKLLGLFSHCGRDVYIVDSIANINQEKAVCISNYKNIHLFIEVQSNDDLDLVRNSWIKYEKLCASIMSVITGNLNVKLFDEEITLEQVTYNIKCEEYKKIYEFLSDKQLNKCRLAGRSVIGLDCKGNVFPCVALQYNDFCLGNIFVDDTYTIKKNYKNFATLLTCRFCCQARSYAKYQQLNHDFLCKYNHKEDE